MRGEERVQVRHERVAQAERSPHLSRHVVSEEIRPERDEIRTHTSFVALAERVEKEAQVGMRMHSLSPLRLEFGVRAEERMEDCGLVPAHEQGGRRIAKEAADIRTDEGDPR